MGVVNLHLDLFLMPMRRSRFGILCSRFGIAPGHNHNLADWPPLIQRLESALLCLVVFPAFCMSRRDSYLLLVHIFSPSSLGDLLPQPLSVKRNSPATTWRNPRKSRRAPPPVSAERQPDVPTT